MKMQWLALSCKTFYKFLKFSAFLLKDCPFKGNLLNLIYTFKRTSLFCNLGQMYELLNFRQRQFRMTCTVPLFWLSYVTIQNSLPPFNVFGTVGISVAKCISTHECSLFNTKISYHDEIIKSLNSLMA